MIKFLKVSMSISSWITTPPIRHPRSRRGSPAGLTTTSILRRLPRHGSIRSSAGSPNSPESRSSEVSTHPSDSSSRHPHLHRRAKQKPEKGTPRLIRQHRLDGRPLIVGEFVACDSSPQFGSLNHRVWPNATLPGRPRLDAYGEEADISQPTITAETVENDPTQT